MPDWKEEQKAFEDWFLNSLPDVDETLLKDIDAEGLYQDKTVSLLFTGWCAGWTSNEIRRG